MTAIAIVLAGGSGSRVGTDLNKVYLPVGQRPLLQYSLETMDRSPSIDEIIVVARPDECRQATQVVADGVKAKRAQVVVGGQTRHMSELAGLNAIQNSIADGTVNTVAIHDGARPFMTTDLLGRVLEAATSHGGAIPALPIDQPVYRVGRGELSLLVSGGLRRVQTPQAFGAQDLLAAYEESVRAGFEGLDTADTVQHHSAIKVRIVPGDPRNLKVTFADDVIFAEQLALMWNDGSWAHP